MSKNKDKLIAEKVYARTKKGWGIAVWREMAQEISLSRELVWMMFLRDFKSRYKQSLLGVIWTIIQPIIAVATFVFLNRSGLLNVSSTGVPYPVYLLLGLTIWQVFAGGLVAMCNSVVSGGNMVVKINFPKETLVFSAFGQVIFEVLIRMVLLIIVMVSLGVTPGWSAVLFPLMLLPLALVTLGLGLILAMLNTFFRDIGNAVSVVLPLLMFLTPIVYPIPEKGMLAILMSYNPITPFVDIPRMVFFSGLPPGSEGIMVAVKGIFSLVFFLFCWRIFHMTEPKMAEKA